MNPSTQKSIADSYYELAHWLSSSGFVGRVRGRVALQSQGILRIGGEGRRHGKKVKWAAILSLAHDKQVDEVAERRRAADDAAFRHNLERSYRLLRLPTLTYEELAIPLRAAFKDTFPFSVSLTVIDVLVDSLELGTIASAVSREFALRSEKQSAIMPSGGASGAQQSSSEGSDGHDVYTAGKCLLDLVTVVFLHAARLVLLMGGSYWPWLIAQIFRLRRIQLLLGYMDQLNEDLKINVGIFAVFRFLLVLISVPHWGACIWWLLFTYDTSALGLPSWITQWSAIVSNGHRFDPAFVTSWQAYLMSLYMSWCGMTAIGYGSITLVRQSELVYAIVVIVVQIVFYAFVLGTLFHYLVRVDESTVAFKELLKSVDQYTTRHALPSSVARKIRAHFEFQHRKKAAGTEIILNQMPLSLRLRVASERYYQQVERSWIFYQCGAQFLNQLVMALKELYVMPLEILFQRGDGSNELHWLLAGTLHVRKGDVHIETLRSDLGELPIVGEIAFILGVHQPYTVTASGAGEVTLLLLSLVDHESVISSYPEQADVAIQNLLRQYSLTKAGADTGGKDAAIDAAMTDEEREEWLELKETVRHALLDRNNEALTQMTYAASQGDVDAVRALAARGLDLNAGDYDKRSVLHLAAAEGNLRVVALLIELGADLNVRDRWGSTAMKDAVDNGHDPVVDLLRASGVTLEVAHAALLMSEAVAQGNIPMLTKLIDNGLEPNLANYDKRTPLHLAAATGNEEVVQFLVTRLADVGALDRWGESALDLAIINQRKLVAELLVRSGSRASALRLTRAVCDAASKGDVDRLRFLVQTGAQIDQGDYDNRTALHIAACSTSISAVLLLVNAMADAKVTDRWGNPPLVDALRANIESAALLINYCHVELPAHLKADPEMCALMDEARKVDMYAVNRKLQTLDVLRQQNTQLRRDATRELGLSFKQLGAQGLQLLKVSKPFYGHISRSIDKWIATYEEESGSSENDDDESVQSDEDGSCCTGESSENDELNAHDVAGGSAPLGAHNEASHEPADDDTSTAATFTRIVLRMPRAETGLVSMRLLFSRRLGRDAFSSLDHSERHVQEEATLRDILERDLLLPEMSSTRVLSEVYLALGMLAKARRRRSAFDQTAKHEHTHTHLADDGSRAEAARFAGLSFPSELGFTVLLCSSHLVTLLAHRQQAQQADKQQAAGSAEDVRSVRVSLGPDERASRFALAGKDSSRTSLVWASASGLRLSSAKRLSANDAGSSPPRQLQVTSVLALLKNRQHAGVNLALANATAPAEAPPDLRRITSTTSDLDASAHASLLVEQTPGSLRSSAALAPKRLTGLFRASANARRMFSAVEGRDARRSTSRVSPEETSAAEREMAPRSAHQVELEALQAYARTQCAFADEIADAALLLHGLFRAFDRTKQGEIKLRDMRHLQGSLGSEMGSAEIKSLIDFLVTAATGGIASAGHAQQQSKAQRKRRGSNASQDLGDFDEDGSESGLDKGGGASAKKLTTLTKLEFFTGASSWVLASTAADDGPDDLRGARTSTARANPLAEGGVVPLLKLGGRAKPEVNAGADELTAAAAKLAVGAPVKEQPKEKQLAPAQRALSRSLGVHAGLVSLADHIAVRIDSGRLEKGVNVESGTLTAIVLHSVALDPPILFASDVEVWCLAALGLEISDAGIERAQQPRRNSLLSAVPAAANAMLIGARRASIASQTTDATGSKVHASKDEPIASTPTADPWKRSRVDGDAGHDDALLEAKAGPLVRASWQELIRALRSKAESLRLETTSSWQPSSFWQHVHDRVRRFVGGAVPISPAGEQSSSVGGGLVQPGADRSDGEAPLGAAAEKHAEIVKRSVIRHTHPAYSAFHAVFLLACFWEMMMQPVQLAFFDEIRHFAWLFYVNTILDAAYLLRILFRLQLTYVNEQSVMISDLAKIRMHYLSTELYFDLCCSFPLNLFAFVLGRQDTILILWLRLFRLGLLKYLLRAYKAWEKRQADNDLLSGLMRYVAVLLYVAHVMSCIWNALGFNLRVPHSFGDDPKYDTWIGQWNDLFRAAGVLPENDFLSPYGSFGWQLVRRYTNSLFLILSLLTTLGVSQIPSNYVELSFCVLQMLGNMTIYAWCVGQISALVMRQDEEIVTKRAQLELVHGFLSHIDVSLETKTQIESFFQARLRNASLSLIKDDDIYEAMPISLQITVSKHTNLEYLVNTKVFAGCKEAFMIRLSSLLRERSIEPENYLFRVGDSCKELFVIEMGNFAIIEGGEPKDGAELDEDSMELIGAGDTAGSLAFVFGLRHFQSARASSDGEAKAFALTTERYRALLKNFPEEEEKLMENAMQQFDGMATSRSKMSRVSASQESEVGSVAYSATGLTPSEVGMPKDGLTAEGGVVSGGVVSNIGKVIMDARRRRDEMNVVALNTACANGELVKVQRILSSGQKEVNKGDYDKRRPIHLAACGGHVQMIELLVSANADVNVQDRFGGTPLTDAIDARHDEAASLLHKFGAERRTSGLAARLLECAADAHGLEALRYLLLYQSEHVSCCDAERRTALHVAAACCHVPQLNLLLELKADINAQDSAGCTPLQDAFKAKSAACAQILLALGANMGTFDVALHMCDAAANGDVDSLARMIECGVCAWTADYDGRTPLHLAASNSHVAACTLLLNTQGVDPSVQDRFGNTPLDDACRATARDSLVVRTLLESRECRPGSHQPAPIEVVQRTEEMVLAEETAMVDLSLSIVREAGTFSAWLRKQREETSKMRKLVEQAVKLEREHGGTILSEAMPSFWPALQAFTESQPECERFATGSISSAIARWVGHGELLGTAAPRCHDVSRVIAQLLAMYRKAAKDLERIENTHFVGAPRRQRDRDIDCRPEERDEPPGMRRDSAASSEYEPPPEPPLVGDPALRLDLAMGPQQQRGSVAGSGDEQQPGDAPGEPQESVSDRHESERSDLSGGVSD